MKKLTILTTLFLLLSSWTSTYAQKSITLRTYYPEPIGAYVRIQFIPNNDFTSFTDLTIASCKVGSIFLQKAPLLGPSTNAEIYACYYNETTNSSLGTWNLLQGIWSSSSPYIFLSDIPAYPNIKVGIGTSDPEFKLTLNNDGGILALDYFDDPDGILTTIDDDDDDQSRFIWHPKKTALRAGALSLKDIIGGDDYDSNGTQWDEANIGEFSSAFGHNNLSNAEASMVLGGENNQAQSNYTTIAGGHSNTITNAVQSSIVGGSSNNINPASAKTDNIILGGFSNQILTSYSIIAGGESNIIQTSDYGSIGGGTSNLITLGNYSSIIGGENNENKNDYSVIGGGKNNNTGKGETSSIVGGSENAISESSATEENVIIGGSENYISEPSKNSGILGGKNSTLESSYSSIVGGQSNSITAGVGSSEHNTIIGGFENTIQGRYTFIGGGWSQAIADDIGPEDHTNAIGGGSDHRIENSQYGFVTGGANNEIFLTTTSPSVISGGQSNTAHTSPYSWIGGKNMFASSSDSSFIWGHAATDFTITGISNAFLIFPNSATTGRVGIGTIAPNYRLDVVGGVHASESLYLTSVPPGSSSDYLYIDGTGNFLKGLLDLAETFEAKQAVEQGDVLSMTNDNTNMLQKSSSPYDRKIIGIVSTAPAIIFKGSETIMSPQPLKKGEQTTTPSIALKGRVPVKVTLENGPIKAGDALTSSSVPGHAMKSTDIEKSFGTTIGKALGNFSGGPNGETEGMIVVFVSLY